MSTTPIYGLELFTVGETGWGNPASDNFTDIENLIAYLKVPHDAPTWGATTTLDLNDARVFAATNTGVSTVAFANIPSNSFAVRWLFIVTNGGANAITWPAAVSWLYGSAPVLQVSGVDIIEFATIDGGTTVYGMHWSKRLAGRIGSTNTDVGTSAATAETTLHTVSVPANAMRTNGALRITVHFDITGSAGNKTLRVKYGGTTFFSVVFAAGETGNGILELLIANRNSASSQVAKGHYTNPTGLQIGSTQATGTVNSALAQDVLVTGETPSAADEVTARVTMVEVLPS